MSGGRVRLLLLLGAAALTAGACGGPGDGSGGAATSTVPGPPEPVLVGAGDIADCDSPGDEATAALLDGIAGTVATFGDNAYEAGSRTEFARCYEPTWGRHRDRTRPAPGNHDYGTVKATGYFDYFGPRAGSPAKGYYSYDIGDWHAVVLNSNCSMVPCSAGSAQQQWLEADLAASRATCTLAYWHHPRFSSGRHGSAGAMADIWQTLYDAGADVVLAGHDHDYERFAPLGPAGKVDTARGIRSFVVGTGGKSLRGFGAVVPGSEVRNGDTFGVIALTLRPTGYDWRFVPEAGRAFTDAGTGTCH
jgi:hypothetical protein